jgi:hypothetical protein
MNSEGQYQFSLPLHPKISLSEYTIIGSYCQPETRSDGNVKDNNLLVLHNDLLMSKAKSVCVTPCSLVRDRAYLIVREITPRKGYAKLHKNSNDKKSVLCCLLLQKRNQCATLPERWTGNPIESVLQPFSFQLLSDWQILHVFVPEV